MSYCGPTEVHFCQKGVKTGAKVYQEDILDKVVKPLGNTLFKNKPWVFQQDSAPAHKAKSTQEWFRRNNIALITTEEWPSSSPDLNPLDYKIWSYLEEKVCSQPHMTLDRLKTAIVKAVADIDMNVVRAAIDDLPRRLRTVSRQEETILNKCCSPLIVTYSCFISQNIFIFLRVFYLL